MPTTTNLDRPANAPARRLGDFFDLDFPDLFRWFEERRPNLLGNGERIRVEEEAVNGVLHIRAEVPGIDPDKDATITVDDGMLRIEVERRQEIKTEEAGNVRSEFRYGSFHRALALPKGADSSAVNATYKDGILEVTVPLPEPSAGETQKVAIQRG